MIPYMWSGVPEGLLANEPALPVRFHGLWHHTCAITPERELTLAVLWQAVIDLAKYRFARRHREQRLYIDAYEWVFSDDRSWPYSFVNLCDVLGLAATALRAELLTVPAKRAGELRGLSNVKEAA